MVRVQTAGQCAECREDQLGRRDDEATTRNLTAFEVQPKLGMVVARHLRSRVVAHGFMAQNDTRDLDLYLQPAAAMIRKARIVIADDPRPIEPVSEIRQQIARLRRQSVAAESVVKAVAETVEPCSAGAFDLGSQRGQRGLRIIRRKELTETGVPARLFEVQVRDQQRILRGPEQRAVGRRLERFACERKGNHGPALTPAPASIQSDVLACPSDRLRASIRSRRPMALGEAELLP